MIIKVVKTGKGEITLKHCKLISLLSIFIETGNRKITDNYQIILKNIFNKNNFECIKSIIKAKKFSKEQEDSKSYCNIFEVLIYDLLSSMNDKLVLSISKPPNATLNSLLLGIGSCNWNFKSKVYACINFKA